MKEPKVTGCTCDFSGGTRGMDRCHRCNGTGSRFLVETNGNALYFPNTRNGYEDACRTLGVDPEPVEGSECQHVKQIAANALQQQPQPEK